jgi:hypothetical protein
MCCVRKQELKTDVIGFFLTFRGKPKWIARAWRYDLLRHCPEYEPKLFWSRKLLRSSALIFPELFFIRVKI